MDCARHIINPLDTLPPRGAVSASLMSKSTVTRAVTSRVAVRLSLLVLLLLGILPGGFAA